MSATHTSTNSLHPVDHLDIPTCKYCEHWCNPDTAVADAFCSEYCRHADKGRRVLNQIQSDHTRCATCFRRIKTVEKPPASASVTVEPPAHEGAVDDVRDVLVGYQYQTEHTVWGVDDFGTDAVPALKRQRWSCECGNVYPRERDDILEGVDLGATIHRCFDALVDCHEEGAIEDAPDVRRYEQALQREGADFEFVIGYALHDA